MSRSRLLVLTTVHSPDDTRIRERLIRSLEPLGAITYACKTPGPSDRSGLTWLPLRGGRLRRNLATIGILLGGSWDLVVLHDPETIPAGALARLIRRTTLVFDVHENLPAQVAQKGWIPRWARPPFRWLARMLFVLAEKATIITLAEPGYGDLFARPHPVFPNYPRSVVFPDPEGSGDGTALYVGDVTRVRGIEDAVAACAIAGLPLVIVGRVDPQLRDALVAATPAPVIHGPLPNPEALRRMTAASVALSPLRDLPNYRHSVPTKTLEYLATGVPVVATDLPGTRSVLDGLDAVWLVPPGDPEAMAVAIAEASTEEAKERATAQAAEVRVRFRWPEEEVVTFYDGLLRRG